MILRRSVALLMSLPHCLGERRVESPGSIFLHKKGLWLKVKKDPCCSHFPSCMRVEEKEVGFSSFSSFSGRGLGIVFDTLFSAQSSKKERKKEPEKRSKPEKKTK